MVEVTHNDSRLFDSQKFIAIALAYCITFLFFLTFIVARFNFFGLLIDEAYIEKPLHETTYQSKRSNRSKISSVSRTASSSCLSAMVSMGRNTTHIYYAVQVISIIPRSLVT